MTALMFELLQDCWKHRAEFTCCDYTHQIQISSFIVVFLLYFSGTWSGKDVYPQGWQATLCRRQKYHLLCPSQAGAHGHHCRECIQVSVALSVPTVSNTVTLQSCSQHVNVVHHFQRGQTALTRLPHLVCASEEHAVRTEAEGTGRAGLFHQHRWIYPGPDPLWWRPALHGVWKCFQGVFSYILDMNLTSLLSYE